MHNLKKICLNYHFFEQIETIDCILNLLERKRLTHEIKIAIDELKDIKYGILFPTCKIVHVPNGIPTTIYEN